SGDGGASPSSSDSPTVSGQPAEAGGQEPAEGAPENTPPSGQSAAPTDGVGYVTDDVDHWAREAYDFVYYSYAPSNLTDQMIQALKQLAEAYNFNVSDLTANGDADAYITNLQTLLLTEPDGILSDVNPEFKQRVADIINEDGTPCVSMFNLVTDSEDRALIPCVVMDQFYNGGRQIEWLSENYTKYWGDGADRSEIALLTLGWSASIDLNTRTEGSMAKFRELFPGQTVLNADGVTESLTSEGGYNLTNSVISAHPEVKYWFISACVEDLALGAGRAVEALGKQDTVLITASGAAILPGEWDAGYEGVWVGNYSVSPFQYAGSAIFGLIALADGRATMGTLWPEHINEGDLAARYMMQADIMTHDNYKQYLGDIVRSFGLEYEG
ncbi:MAG: substrate-binding domain-containing protein, partial [Oscillospiraceae bacterium]|nr:substrate-binding domain-containing protein [Oscillospiraceae bacterium]